MKTEGKRIVALVVCVLLLVSGCGQENTKETDGHTVKKEIYAMDTIMDLSITGENAGEIMNEAIDLIHKYERLFSVNIENSDIARINAASGQAVSVSEETYDLVGKSITMANATEGLLDISIYPLVKAWGFTTENYRIPQEQERKEILKQVNYKKIQLLDRQRIQIGKNMQLDLGSVAKGYLSQKIMELLKNKGVETAILSLGGNVQTLGQKTDGSLYQIGITDPADGTSIYGTISVQDEAVVTSGIYQRYFEQDGVRYHHIMDKRTGKPANNDLASVTIITEDGTTADGLATALYVMGDKKAKAYQKNHENIQIILIYKDGTSWNSDGIEFNRKKGM